MLFGIDGLTPQIFSTVLLAALGLVGKIFLGGSSSSLAKDVRHHAELRGKLEVGTAAAAELDELLAAETLALKERSLARLTRKVNPGAVAAVIVVTVLGGLVFYGLWSGTAAVADGLWFWVLVVVTALYGLFFLAFMLVGLGKIYDPVAASNSQGAA